MQELPPEAIAALEQGRTIEAIKIVRERTGLGLKESKELIERHAARSSGNEAPHGADEEEDTAFGRLGPRADPMAEPGRVRGGGIGTWLMWAVAIVLVVLAWMYFSGRP